MQRILYFLLLFSILSSTAIGSCSTDSTIVHYREYNNDYEMSYYYDLTTYHTDRGSYDKCYFTLINGSWQQNSCDSSYYSDKVKTYSSSGLLIEEISRTGSPNGWLLTLSHRLEYNANGQVNAECNLIPNGSGWDTIKAEFSNYVNGILIERYSQNYYSGIKSNFFRMTYSLSNGIKDSLLFQIGSGQTWINDSLLVFQYTGNIRSAVDIYRWDANNIQWIQSKHAAYDPNLNTAAIYYDSVQFFVMDTLENIISRNDIREEGCGGDYHLNISKFINGEYRVVRDVNAMSYTYIDDVTGQQVCEADMSCTYPNAYYYYDSQGRMTSKDDYSRCVMPNHAHYDYNYDPDGFLREINYTFESNMHDRSAHDIWYRLSSNDPIMIINPLTDNHICASSAVTPSFFVSGGCGPYTVQWSPQTGLSSDSVMYPQITVTDSITYTIIITDQTGAVINYTYTLVPYYAELVNQFTSCNGSNWGQLIVNTNADYDFNFHWSRNGSNISNAWYRTYNYNQAGSYTVKLENYNTGCILRTDTISIAAPGDSVSQYTDICSGAAFTLPDGQLATSQGTYYSMLSNMNGCDSIISTVLSVTAPVYATVMDIYSGVPYTLPDGQFAQSAGTYTCTLTSAAGCDSIVTVILADQTTGLSRLNKTNIQVGPVPVKNILKIKSEQQDLRVEIISSLGVVLKKSNQKEIDMGEYQAGVYIVKIFSKNEMVYYGTVIKE